MRDTAGQFQYWKTKIERLNNNLFVQFLSFPSSSNNKLWRPHMKTLLTVNMNYDTALNLSRFHVWFRDSFSCHIVRWMDSPACGRDEVSNTMNMCINLYKVAIVTFYGYILYAYYVFINFRQRKCFVINCGTCFESFVGVRQKKSERLQHLLSNFE